MLDRGGAVCAGALGSSVSSTRDRLRRRTLLMSGFLAFACRKFANAIRPLRTIGAVPSAWLRYTAVNVPRAIAAVAFILLWRLAVVAGQIVDDALAIADRTFHEDTPEGWWLWL